MNNNNLILMIKNLMKIQKKMKKMINIQIVPHLFNLLKLINKINHHQIIKALYYKKRFMGLLELKKEIKKNILI